MTVKSSLSKTTTSGMLFDMDGTLLGAQWPHDRHVLSR